MGNGYAAVAVPAKTPPVYSLVTSARTVPPEPGFFIGEGLKYQPSGCDNSGLFDPCDRTDEKSGGLDDESRPDEVVSNTFGVYAHAACGTWSKERIRGLPAEARQNLLACQSKQIAREFWEGTKAQAQGWGNVYLRKTGADILGASLDPVDALACLEQGLRECGCGARGMIHATAQVATLWTEANLIETDGRVAYTKLGTIVVPDAGYTGRPPEGTTDVSDVVWAFATEMVDLRLSDILELPGTLAEATNRKTNEVVYRAERLANISFDGCCRVAVGIGVTGCLATEFGS